MCVCAGSHAVRVPRVHDARAYLLHRLHGVLDLQQVAIRAKHRDTAVVPRHGGDGLHCRGAAATERRARTRTAAAPCFLVLPSPLPASSLQAACVTAAAAWRARRGEAKPRRRAAGAGAGTFARAPRRGARYYSAGEGAHATKLEPTHLRSSSLALDFGWAHAGTALQARNAARAATRRRAAVKSAAGARRGGGCRAAAEFSAAAHRVGAHGRRPAVPSAAAWRK